MAYFPNGSAGEILDRQCAKCPLGGGGDRELECCPVETVQLLYNYDQCDKGQEKLREAMNLLIDEKGICQVGSKLTEKLEAGVSKGKLEAGVSKGIEAFKRAQREKFDENQLQLDFEGGE